MEEPATDTPLSFARVCVCVCVHCSYWLLVPFTMVTTMFVVVDMRQHFKIVEKVEDVERKRIQTVYEKTGELPDKYRKSINSLPTSFSIPSDSGPTSPQKQNSRKSLTESLGLWSKLGSYKDSSSSPSQQQGHHISSVTDNPLVSIDERWAHACMCQNYDYDKNNVKHDTPSLTHAPRNAHTGQ